MHPRSLLVENRQAPGDLLVMTAAVRALHSAYPGEYVTYVSSSCPSVWENNPLISSGPMPPGAVHLRLGYSKGINCSNQTRGHFATGFAVDLATRLRRDVPLQDMRPHVVLRPDEGPVNGLAPYSYWVVMAGGKKDFTAKLWGFSRWQQLVNLTPDITWVQAGSAAPMGIQRGLDGVVNLVGKTNYRQFLRLVAFSRGVVCPITSGMHAAAAFNRPCVVVAGGREPWWWEAYTRETWRVNCGTEPPADFMPHAYLHTMGQLSCCRHHGCWKSGVGEKRTSNCVDVVKAVERVPHCLALLTPEMVAQSVRAYERGEQPAENAIPDFLGPCLKRGASPAPRAARKPREPLHPRRPAGKPVERAYVPAETGRTEIRPQPTMRLADIAPGRVLDVLGALRVVIEPVPGFQAANAVVQAVVRRYTPAEVAEGPGEGGWCVWLAPGVRPTAPGWLWPVAAAAARGSRIVAGAAGGWLAAGPEIAAGLKGANWRTLLGTATRVRGIRMETEKPGVYV